MHEYQRLYEILKTELSKLFYILYDYIPNEEKDPLKNSLNEYLSHDEYGLVYESLCEIIISCKIPISQENFDTIAKLGHLMEYDEKEWLRLKKIYHRQPI